MDFLRRLKLVIQTHRKRVSPFPHGRLTKTELATNFRQESDMLGGSSRSCVNSGEESALPMVSSLRPPTCKYEGIVSLDCSRKKISPVSE